MDSNIKPYNHLLKSIVDLFKAPERYIKESNIKESQFEKPYLDTEYRQMHLDLPIPDWPDMRNPPDLGDVRPQDSEAVDISEGAPCPGCGLYGDHIHEAHCADSPVEIHAGIFCTKYFGTWQDCELSIAVPIGHALNVTDGAWTYIGPSKAVWLDPDVKDHVVIGKLVDGSGNECYVTVEQKCGNCNSIDPVAIDTDDTPSTMAAGTGIPVYVNDGIGPFTWSVDGLGYILSSKETTGRNNGLYCASGD